MPQFEPQQVQFSPQFGSTENISGPTTNGEVSILLNAANETVIVLPGFVVSYAGSGTLSGGRVTVEMDGEVVFSMDIQEKGVYPIFLGMQAHPEEPVEVILAAGGANVAGTLNLSPPPYYRQAGNVDAGPGPGGGYGYMFNVPANSMWI